MDMLLVESTTQEETITTAVTPPPSSNGAEYSSSSDDNVAQEQNMDTMISCGMPDADTSEAILDQIVTEALSSPPVTVSILYTLLNNCTAVRTNPKLEKPVKRLEQRFRQLAGRFKYQTEWAMRVLKEGRVEEGSVTHEHAVAILRAAKRRSVLRERWCSTTNKL